MSCNYDKCLRAHRHLKANSTFPHVTFSQIIPYFKNHSWQSSQQFNYFEEQTLQRFWKVLAISNFSARSKLKRQLKTAVLKV